jgi:hypothetical protein
VTLASYRYVRLCLIPEGDRDGMFAFARDLGIRGTELDTLKNIVWNEDIKAYLFSAIRVRS